MNEVLQTARRRSPVHELLWLRACTWTQVKGMPVALRFQDAVIEAGLRERLALCDVSCFPKMSVKGPAALQRLGECGVEIPPNLYETSQREDGALVVRVDTQEVFLEEGLDSNLVTQLRNQLDSASPGVLCIDRQEAAFWLSGTEAIQVLAQTCGVDFRKPQPRWVFSRVAGVSCGLLPWNMNGTPIFRIWTDASYGAYLWEELLKIVQELEGDAVGLGCFYPALDETDTRNAGALPP